MDFDDWCYNLVQLLVPSLIGVQLWAGLVGSSIGEAVLGSWGPNVAGMIIIPSIIGAIVVVVIVSFLFYSVKLFSNHSNY